MSNNYVNNDCSCLKIGVSTIKILLTSAAFPGSKYNVISSVVPMAQQVTEKKKDDFKI